jgi:hypothetical protein
MTENPRTTLIGRVEKIIESPVPTDPQKAQIAIEGADHLYRELRIENILTDARGNAVHLQAGDKVEVTVVAQPNDVP